MPLRTKAQLPVGEYLLEFARSILRKTDLSEKARAYTSVTLRRRFRGISKTDLFGLFDAHSGNWIGDNGEMENFDLYSFQIVKSVIRANLSAMIQAKVECTIEARAKKDPGLAGAAAVAKGIYQYINNHPDYWSNNFASQTQQQVQTDYGCFVHTHHDPDADSRFTLKVQEYADQPQEQPGKYVCAHCATEGPMFTEQMGKATEDGTLPCLKCGETAEIESYPEMSDVPSFQTEQEYPAGNTVQDVVSSYQIRIDEKNTKNGNLRKARWLEHHFLEEEDDLQARVPYFELPAPMEWSFPLKWEYCLETGTDLYLKSWTGDGLDSNDKRPHEVRRIYMQPSQYRHYVAPADYDMDRGDGQMALNREGNPMLSIKAGQKLIDIYPNGFWYEVANDQLLPSAEACSLLDEWAYMYYMNDSASFHGQPASELNELARAADNFWTIVVQHLESSSIATTVFNRRAFDPETFEHQLSPTREGFDLDVNGDIRKHFAQVQPPPMNGAMQGVEFIQSIVGSVAGPQPSMVGQAQPGVAYATVALQREQSLGQLTTALHSMAECKAAVTTQHLKHAQRTRPDEWFQHIRTMYGEEWKDQDIQAFLDCDVDLDLEVGYKETSVQPQSLVQRELKLRAVIMDMAEIAKAIGKPELITPELLAQYGDVSGIQFDIADTEADQRLADIRYRKIRSRLEEKKDSGLHEDALVAEVMNDPLLLTILPKENHAVAIEFLTDQGTAQLGQEMPDYALVKCILELIKRHEEGGVIQAQTDDANMIEGKAPTIAAQLAAAQAQQGDGGAAAAKADAEKEQQKLAQDAAKTGMTLDAKAQEGQAERAFKASEAEKDREHDAGKTEAEMALTAAELASNHPDGGHPLDKVSESLAYKDLAVEAKKDMLRHVGLSTEGVKDTQVTKPPPSNGSKPKARPLA